MFVCTIVCITLAPDRSPFHLPVKTKTRAVMSSEIWCDQCVLMQIMCATLCTYICVSTHYIKSMCIYCIRTAYCMFLSTLVHFARSIEHVQWPFKISKRYCSQSWSKDLQNWLHKFFSVTSIRIALLALHQEEKHADFLGIYTSLTARRGQQSGKRRRRAKG